MTTPDRAMPLRSGLPYLSEIPAAQRRAFYGYIMRSIGNVLPFLRGSVAEDEPLPDHAVTTTFARIDAAGNHEYLTNLTRSRDTSDGDFVTGLTHAVALERQTGIERLTPAMRATQNRLGDAAQLVSVGALLGIREQNMRVGQVTGVVALAYMGDGQIVAAVLQQDGSLQHITLVNTTDPNWRVVFPSGSYDLRGDLGFLYSALTVTDDELTLLL